jgi:hypothetical protein
MSSSENTNAIVMMVTSANAGPWMMSWIALSVSRSTAEVAEGKWFINFHHRSADN